VPLKRGRNLFAVKILAGSQGWRFVAGGPSDLSHGSLANVERMDISLVSKDKTVVATGTSLINYRRPAPVQSSDFWAMRPADWGGLEPTAKLGEAQVTNLFFKDPDTSRWWKGDGDLSAIIWLRQDSSHIYTVVEVTDDIDKQASNPADMAEWDHINIALAGNDGKVNEWAIGRVADAPVVRQVRGDASPAQQVRGAVDRDANRTLYRFAIPRSLVTGDSVRMNVIVTDNDDGYRKQYASWTPFPSDAPEPSPDRWQIIELR